MMNRSFKKQRRDGVGQWYGKIGQSEKGSRLMRSEQKLCYKHTMTNWYMNIKAERITYNQGNGICIGLARNFMSDDS